MAVADVVEVLRAAAVELEAHPWEPWEGRMEAVAVAMGRVGPQQPEL